MQSNRCFTILIAATAATAITILTPVVQATVAFDGTQNYTQNFDNLTSSNSTSNQRPWIDDATVTPPGNTAGTNSLPGWYIQQSVNAGAGNYQRFRGNGGSSISTTGSIYSYGASGNSNRALGILESSTVGTEYIALRLENTSSQAITSFTLNYTGEQWFVGSLTSNQTLTFGYAVEAGSIQSTAFTTNSALSFVSPKNATTNGATGGVDGTSATYQTAEGATITGLDWEPGQDLWLRWAAPGPISGSHGLAIDNLTFTATPSGATSVGSPTWNLNSDGVWNAGDTSSWLNANAPTGTGGTVRLGSQITADHTVTLDTSPTVNTLEFNGGAHNYTLAANPGNQLNIAAGGSIVTNGVSFNSDNTPSAGNQISAPLNFASSAEFQVNDPLAELTVSGAITVGANGGLHKTGSGDLVLTHANSYSGPTVIDGGSVSITDGSQLGDNSPTNGITVNNGGQIKLNANITMSRSLTFAGDGGVGTDFNVNFGGPLNAPAANILTKTGVGTLQVSSLHAGTTYIVGNPTSASAGVLQILPDGTNAATSKISFLRIQTDAGGLYLGKLDITNNALVIDYTGTSPLTNINTFTSASGVTLGNGSKIDTALWYAYDSGHWDRTGITSSLATTAATDPKSVHSVAYAEASTLLGLTGTSTAQWHGQTVDSTSLLLMYTLAGDVNMDGKIDADDYAIVDRTIAKGTFTTEYSDATGAVSHAHWTDGDFNFDGAVDSKDMLILDTSLAFQSGGLSPAFLAEREAEYGSAYVSSLLASIPEPASLSLLLAALPLAGRRRRNPGH